MAFLAVLIGLMLLVWSADRFVEGSASAARHFGMPPLLIGMVVIGFGTSAPEMVVSAIAAYEGNPGIALGNAYGSNITNIGLILGLTALISPVAVHSQILRRELPLLSMVTGLSVWLLWDGEITRWDAVCLFVVFAGQMGWSIHSGMQNKPDQLAADVEQELDEHGMPVRRALMWLFVGLLVLIVSSRLLVWGAVEMARGFGVDEMMIGLTIVAIGTSLPELAASIIAVRKGEHDLAVGNVIGSNLFNTLAVVGIAGAIHPMQIGEDVLGRDVLVMGILTLSLFALGHGVRRAGYIHRSGGGLLVSCYAGYLGYLIISSGAAP